MGIFNFGKKKENEQEPQNLKSPTEFFVGCLIDYHEAAKKKGYALGGPILIPELVPMGQKAALAYLKDDFFRMEFADNPEDYYYAVSGMCFMTGVVYASVWHTDFSKLTEEFQNHIISYGPPEYSNPVLMNDVGMTKEQINDMHRTVYSRFVTMHMPYWQLKDPREYTFNAMLASYQLGISIVLDKYGYKN